MIPLSSYFINYQICQQIRSFSNLVSFISLKKSSFFFRNIKCHERISSIFLKGYESCGVTISALSPASSPFYCSNIISFHRNLLKCQINVTSRRTKLTFLHLFIVLCSLSKDKHHVRVANLHFFTHLPLSPICYKHYR